MLEIPLVTMPVAIDFDKVVTSSNHTTPQKSEVAKWYIVFVMTGHWNSQRPPRWDKTGHGRGDQWQLSWF